MIMNITCLFHTLCCVFFTKAVNYNDCHTWLTCFIGAGMQVLVGRFGNTADRQLGQGLAR
jgi:hypothetical protein